MLNECFEKYRNAHKGERCILFGTGPTLDKYKYTLGRPLKIGTNEIVYKPYKMDYYFLADPGDKDRGYFSDKETYDNYEPLIAKFYRAKHVDGSIRIPEGAKAEYYNVTSKIEKDGKFIKDITEGMGDYASVSMEALQFILFTGVKEIYLIGHDCNYFEGSFHCKSDKLKSRNLAVSILDAWERAKDWMSKEYSKVRVYIVNPVSLKIFPEISLEKL